MITHRINWLLFIVMVATVSTPFALAHAQGAGKAEVPRATSEQSAARQKILESERWRRTQRLFDEWLSVQVIYSSDEVAAIRADLNQQVAQMSPAELEQFLVGMEERLDVLTSPEAEDARIWLEQFMAVAVNPEQQLGMARPDLLNMTASQVRVELNRLNQIREQRSRSRAAFDRSRSAQAQVSREALTARQAKRAPAANRSSWPANTPAPRENRTPPDLQPPPLQSMIYTVSPWGLPILLYP